MSRSTQIKYVTIRNRNYLMPFGKYKNVSIADLIDVNAQYLVWLHENTDFEIRRLLRRYRETRMEDAVAEAKKRLA